MHPECRPGSLHDGQATGFLQHSAFEAAATTEDLIRGCSAGPEDRAAHSTSPRRKLTIRRGGCDISCAVARRRREADAGSKGQMVAPGSQPRGMLLPRRSLTRPAPRRPCPASRGGLPGLRSPVVWCLIASPHERPSPTKDRATTSLFGAGPWQSLPWTIGSSPSSGRSRPHPATHVFRPRSGDRAFRERAKANGAGRAEVAQPNTSRQVDHAATLW